MLGELWRLVEGRRVIPTAPAGFVPQLPPTDEPEFADDNFDPELESVAGVGCILTYSNSKDERSFRRVTCRKLSHRNGVQYLQAWCHERESLRTFRLDRIVEAACGVTGEIYVPGCSFFERFSVANDGGSAASFGLHVRLAADLRAGLNVLAFLAKADGRIVPAERDVMRSFCQSFGLRYADDHFDFDGVCEYAQRLAPDAETFFVSLQRLNREEAPGGLSRLLQRFAGDLIEADGEQHPREFYFGVKVQEALA
jgi:hypothetical protein